MRMKQRLVTTPIIRALQTIDIISKARESDLAPGGLIGIAYKVNDWVSVGAQVRYAQQITQAEGYVTDIEGIPS